MAVPWYPYPIPAPIGGGQYALEPAARITPGVLANLREDLVGELQAITQYEAHAAQAADPRVRATLLHIAQDEREHVVELMRLILALDPLQARAFAQPPHA